MPRRPCSLPRIRFTIFLRLLLVKQHLLRTSKDHQRATMPFNKVSRILFKVVKQLPINMACQMIMSTCRSNDQDRRVKQAAVSPPSTHMQGTCQALKDQAVHITPHQVKLRKNSALQVHHWQLTNRRSKARIRGNFRSQGLVLLPPELSYPW